MIIVTKNDNEFIYVPSKKVVIKFLFLTINKDMLELKQYAKNIIKNNIKRPNISILFFFWYKYLIINTTTYNINENINDVNNSAK